MSEFNIPGATAVGLTFDGGVVLAAEKRFTYGNFIMSKTGKKVFMLNSNTGAAFAGMIGDMQVLARNMQAMIRMREMEIRRKMTPNSVAKLMSVVMYNRKMMPFLNQVILAGVEGSPSIYILDALGSVIPDKYAVVGSGTEIAIGVVESEFKDGMSEEKAKQLAIKSIKAAIQRDAASGDGIDLLVISKEGIKEEKVAL
ncbi:MAG TPA: proteasome subunit beta [Conexivisphaerales archaeon]|nr:proteasome subunit beta [Conexivisphaerales archaeon]